MTTRPTDPPGGQDDHPDVLTAIRAAIVLLRDVDDHLGVPERPSDVDLQHRVQALRRALRRLRDYLESRADDSG